MNFRKFRRNTFLTLVLMWTFLLSSFPVNAQIELDSSGLLGGSSAFVFRKSNKTPQSKAITRRNSNNSRSKEKRQVARTRIIKQSNTVAKSSQQKRGTKRVDAATLASLQPKFRTMPKSEASLVFTGAGEYFLDQNNFTESERFFRGALDLDKANKLATAGLSDVLTRQGNKHLESNEFETAELKFKDAIVNDDKNAVAYVGLGQVYDSLDNDSTAIKNYEKALTLDGELTEIYQALGILYAKTDEIAKAETYLEKALQEDADNAETQYFLGLVRFKQNDNVRALSAFNRSAELDADNAETFYYLGQVYDRLDKKQESIAAYEKAVKLNADFAEGWFDLAVAYYNAGTNEKDGKDYFLKAEEAYKQAQKHSNINDKRRLNINSKVNLAETYRQLAALETTPEGKRNYYTKAASELTSATSFIKRQPDLFADSEKDQVAEIYSDWGYVAGQSELNKPSNMPKSWMTTIEALKKASELSSDAIDYTNLGWAYFNAGQAANQLRKVDEAQNYFRTGKEVLQKALEINPRYVAALLNLGMMNNGLNDFRGAVEPLEKALELNNEKAVKIIANNELGIAYFQQNDFDKAAKSFRKVLDENPNFAPAVYSLGETEYKRGNKKEAEKMLEKLRQLGAGYYFARLKGILAGAVLR